jgi:hypothetical protein
MTGPVANGPSWGTLTTSSSVRARACGESRSTIERIAAMETVTTVTPYTMHADDSGKKEMPMVVVGGYLGSSERWALLQNDWIPKVKRHLQKDEFKRSDYNLKKFGSMCVANC